ncbi:major facilitator superfamily domain-containing protein 6-like isoform X1 [Macrobrachium rosenbergii]|uniref:major facilitator superfamily domain-containing protein 6-like isoform X1 n=1 Tax=Macrobrachium rosenbergii TaxID=79674 RepID=UPI0034D79A1D
MTGDSREDPTTDNPEKELPKFSGKETTDFHMSSNKRKMSFTEGLKDFANDLINPRLLILKCTYFFLLSAVVILWPQFTIHQKAIGLSEYQTGTIASVTAVATIFFPFIGGFVGDKVGNYRILMATASIITGGIALFFTWVPSANVETPISNFSDATSSNFSFEVNSSGQANSATEVDDDQLKWTFWIYLCVRTAYGIVNGITYVFFDAAVMANVQNSDVNFGYQRAWGTVGAFISSFLGGVIVEQTGSFNEIFYVSAAMQVVTGLLMLGVNIDFKMPALSLTREIFQLLIRPEPLILYGALFAAGMFTGYFETFMYRYLHELGASEILIGMTVTVGAPFEFIMTLVTCNLAKSFGYVPLITFGLAAHGVQFLGFSFLQNPWWVLPLEAIGSAADGFFLTASVTYLAVLFPTENIASFRGLHGIVHYGLGKFLGIVIGGEMKEHLGHVYTSLIWTGLAVLTSVIYCSAHYALEKYRSTNFSTKHEGMTSKKELSGIDNVAWEGPT